MVLVLVASTLALSACGTSSSTQPPSSNSSIRVVAAENFWGSIAKQIGGSHANVTSIITNPNTDPHAYEPTAQDGRIIASAQMVIENGVGYDSWAAQLIAANPSPSQVILNVGTLVGIPLGGNPHRWYDPANVYQVISAITTDYQKLDPANEAYFAAQKNAFETKSLASYNALIKEIRAKYSGTPIGASESIVSPLAQALGLKLITPYTFLQAISEGTDPTAADKATIDHQIKTKQIKIYIFNSQNATPDVQAQLTEAKAEGIPIVKVTETLVPATATFQSWQTSELQSIAAALAKATGK